MKLQKIKLAAFAAFLCAFVISVSLTSCGDAAKEKKEATEKAEGTVEAAAEEADSTAAEHPKAAEGDSNSKQEHPSE